MSKIRTVVLALFLISILTGTVFAGDPPSQTVNHWDYGITGLNPGNIGSHAIPSWVYSYATVSGTLTTHYYNPATVGSDGVNEECEVEITGGYFGMYVSETQIRNEIKDSDDTSGSGVNLSNRSIEWSGTAHFTDQLIYDWDFEYDFNWTNGTPND